MKMILILWFWSNLKWTGIKTVSIGELQVSILIYKIFWRMLVTKQLTVLIIWKKYTGSQWYHQLFGYQHSSKYLLSFSTKERNSYWFGTTWWWVNDGSPSSCWWAITKYNQFVYIVTSINTNIISLKHLTSDSGPESMTTVTSILCHQVFCTLSKTHLKGFLFHFLQYRSLVTFAICIKHICLW